MVVDLNRIRPGLSEKLVLLHDNINDLLRLYLTSSTLSSYIFFSPRRIEGGVNLDYVPNNIRANNITKLVSNNIKIKPNSRLNNRTHEILFVIFILFPVNLLNCE